MALDALLRGDRRGGCNRQPDPRPASGYLGDDWKNGTGVRDRANRLHTTVSGTHTRNCRRAGNLDVGYGGDFAGALQAAPAGDCAKRAVYAADAADAAEYHGGRAAAGVRRVIRD